MEISNSNVVPRGLIPRGTKKNFKLGDSLSMDVVYFGYSSSYIRTILKKCPFQETGMLLKFVTMVLQGHEQSSGVSDPSKQCSAGSHTPLKKFPRGIIPL